MDLDVRTAEDFVFTSYMRARPFLAGSDEQTRHPELTAQLLEALGQPQRGLPCLLVAGSKGKGSTAAFAAALLGLVAAPVGLFTSPHLLDVRERIRVNGRAISPDRFCACVEQVALAVGPLEQQLPTAHYFSPVGLLLCVALLHFRAEGVSVAVVEAGRGARFDDTRVVDHPVAAITPIMREHRRSLGAQLRRIAWHKAGAITGARVAVSARQQPAAARVLEMEASSQGARLLVVGRDVRVRSRADGTVDIQTTRRCYPSLRPGLRGAHQVSNLALALESVEALRPELADQPIEAIRQAVARTYWPGRCDVLQRWPVVLVDGAINAATARAFVKTALPLSPPPRLAIVGAPSDKDYPGLLRTLGPYVECVYVTRARNPALRFPSFEAVRASNPSLLLVDSPDLESAAAHALARLGRRGSLWIVGTQSLVADALRRWGRDLEMLEPPMPRA